MLRLRRRWTRSIRSSQGFSDVRLLVSIAAIGLALIGTSTRSEAHKPITSPYSYNEDVFPIVKERCASCHVVGGVAPMSLLTHMDAVPWGESIRAELMAGHMPPWGLDSAPARFRNVQGLTARELNVLLTWASGGTPAGDPEKAPVPITVERRWPLGTPDLVRQLPAEVVLSEEMQERVEEFTLPADAAAGRLVRAVDLLPGTAAIVRSATVSVKGAGENAEGLLALWLPGDHPVALDSGTAFRVPASADLVVRVRYRKTWEYERTRMTDRSSVGIYFAEEPATEVRALELSAPAGTTTFTATIDAPLRAIAIYPDPELTDVAVTVTATRPDGSREELIAFRPRAGWARRYWFRDAIPLPRGTRLEVKAAEDEGLLLPPGAIPVTPRRTDASPVRLVLNVVPAID